MAGLSLRGLGEWIMAVSMGIRRGTSTSNCFGQRVRVEERLEDERFWIERRCAVQPDGSEDCDIFFGDKVVQCITIGCSRPAQPGEQHCGDCGSNDYPHH